MFGRYANGGDMLPLGKPALEEALWHLRQLAQQGASDRETLGAIDEVLQAHGQNPTGAAEESPLTLPLGSGAAVPVGANGPRTAPAPEVLDAADDKTHKLALALIQGGS